MKFRIASIAAAVLTTVACAHVSDETLLSGFVDEECDQVRIVCADVDTIIVPEYGQFSIKLPVRLQTVSSVQSNSGAVGFISDGSEIVVDFRADQPFAESSAKSACASYTNLQKGIYDVEEEYSANVSALMEDSDPTDPYLTTKTMEFYGAAMSKVIELSRKALKGNKDNAVALVAISNLYDSIPSDELLEMIESLDPSLQSDEFITSIKSSISASASTAEGSMFVDFESSYDGQTWKLSDFVGKGKYILVDFWASWCAPCRAEIPNLKAVYEKYHSDKFDMLSIAVWDEPEATVKAAAELEIPWNQIINAQNVPTDLYGIDGIPHIILFGPDGTILRRNLRGSDVGRAIEQLVK